jgi:hypothetical protein
MKKSGIIANNTHPSSSSEGVNSCTSFPIPLSTVNPDLNNKINSCTDPHVFSNLIRVLLLILFIYFFAL